MSETEALLPSKDFIRIHRSYIVSQKRISKIERDNIWISKIELPVGASFVKALSKIL